MTDAKTYAQRNQRGSDWFSHDSTAAAAIPVQKPPLSKPNAEPNGDSNVGSSRTQMIKPKCDSNQWFKHEHSGNSEAAAGEPALSAADAAPVAAAAVEESSAPAAAGKLAREGDVYSKRDKSGTSASWFAHEHPGDVIAQQGPRVTSKEGGANATRMRGESENWFSHDGNEDHHDVHVGKGRSGKPQTDSMRQIFNMDK